MRMFPLLGYDGRRDGRVILADTYELREVMELVGRQFQRESHFDFAPFDVEEYGQVGVLFDSARHSASFPIVAGALGCVVRRTGGCWNGSGFIRTIAAGGRLFSQVWPELEATYGKFHIRGPYSKPMEVALHDLGITDGRLI
ncbi:hypothetical protein [Fodinicola feengrottensis]|uniref:hypothetical protein n=1 Tax=Fodinicola feengrottensis TaxID=435914 RepID=UPI002441ADA4|nr:hypothetical protein [Fodinicola feengrottensis]